ncbi:MAG: hypothetical protein GY898_11305 [Proteobacteria bacterium]|nr:hypothetical protein [Pseudomonadota bacterium]
MPDACDPCPIDVTDDSDGDGVCDSEDECDGDDTVDTDGDGTADDCDPCPLDDPDDVDGDGVCDSDDACPGFDDSVDSDGDGQPDGCDPCPADNPDDADGDGVCDGIDVCPGGDDLVDGDTDGTPDFCDECPADPLDLCNSGPGACQAGSVEISTAPSGDMMLCDHPSNAVCEQDLETLCDVGWHLCTMDEYNSYNDLWTQPVTTSERALGVIFCRGATSAAGHFTVPDASSSITTLGQDEVFNCYYGSSRSSCPASYGCNENQAQALCCRDNPTCGNGVVDSPLEQCDDGNTSDADDCLNVCAWRVPTAHSFSGTNCN